LCRSPSSYLVQNCCFLTILLVFRATGHFNTRRPRPFPRDDEMMTFTANLWPLFTAAAAGHTQPVSVGGGFVDSISPAGVDALSPRPVALVLFGTDIIIGKRTPSVGAGRGVCGAQRSDWDGRRGRDNEIKNSIITFRQLSNVYFVVSYERLLMYSARDNCVGVVRQWVFIERPAVRPSGRMTYTRKKWNKMYMYSRLPKWTQSVWWQSVR